MTKCDLCGDESLEVINHVAVCQDCKEAIQRLKVVKPIKKDYGG